MNKINETNPLNTTSISSPELSSSESTVQGVAMPILDNISATTPSTSRTLNNVTPSREIADVAITSTNKQLIKTLSPLHRSIESHYRKLPWPADMQEIVVFTRVQGGRGDIAAAAKAISTMQAFCPSLSFDWELSGRSTGIASYNAPESFLRNYDRTKISIRDPSVKFEPNPIPGNLLLAGPVKLAEDLPFLENCLKRKIEGPMFGFVENGLDPFEPPFMPMFFGQKYSVIIHKALFPAHSLNNFGLLPMGLQQGSGVFLDKARLEAPLSRDYCCPSYLAQIEDTALRNDILDAMNASNGNPIDYDQYSLNSGYAHHIPSWEKFLECVALHEKTKHVVIVANSHGEYNKLSPSEFREKILTKDHINFLKEHGYGTILFKGKDESLVTLADDKTSESNRQLIVIAYPGFLPDDVKRLQLASERLLATGDNSAAEAFCTRCKLYLYECINTKGGFLNQQIDLAQTISPNLSKLLSLFGNKNDPFNQTQRDEVKRLLENPEIGNETLQFCDTIVAQYSFAEVLEAALKRAVWHYRIPNLADIEANVLADDYKKGKTIRASTVSSMEAPIQEAVEKHLGSI